MENKRSVSLDIFRCLVMFMIVLGHSLVHGGILDNVREFTPAYYSSYVLWIFLYVHVDCFVIMSGYFGWKKKFTWKKWLKLWSECFFWSVVLFLLITMFTGTGVSLKELIKSLMPFTQQRYWFMTTYLLMYLLTPLINKAISDMDKITFRRVLIIYFAVFIVFQNIIFWREFTQVNERSPLFFCFLYMIGAYFNKYPVQRKIPWLWIYICSCIVKITYYFGILWITSPIFGEPMGETLLNGYCSFLTIIGAVALFMTFSTVKIKCEKTWGGVFTVLSPLTLGVYLIHDNTSVRAFLWNFLDLPSFIGSGYLIIVLIAASVGIFCVCILMEWVRTKIFVITKLDRLIFYIGDKMDKSLDKLCGGQEGNLEDR